MEELKYVSREDANNAGIHVPRETIKPYASYPVREIIVRGVSNDNEYTVGVLRSFSGQLYLFDVSERISINQSKQIFDYVSQEFTEIYEFHIEYPDTCYDKLASITKSERYLGNLKLSYVQNAAASQKLLEKNFGNRKETALSEDVDEATGIEIKMQAHALYYSKAIKLYSVCKLTRLSNKQKLQSFINSIVLDGDTKTLQEIENTVRYALPTSVIEKTRDCLITAGFMMLRTDKNASLSDIYIGELIAEIEKHTDKHNRDGSIGEIFGTSTEEDKLRMLEKLYRMRVDSWRHLDAKSIAKRRFVVDLLSRFIAPVLTGIMGSLITSLLLASAQP